MAVFTGSESVAIDKLFNLNGASVPMKDVGKEPVLQLAGLRMKFRVAAASKVLCCATRVVQLVRYPRAPHTAEVRVLGLPIAGQVPTFVAWFHLLHLPSTTRRGEGTKRVEQSYIQSWAST